MADKIYVVTLKNYDDLEGFYADMDTEGYKIHLKRPISRNTQYYLTDQQAVDVRTDSRVLAVEGRPEDNPYMELRSNFVGNNTPYGGSWQYNKSNSGAAFAANDTQWGLLHVDGDTAARRKGSWGWDATTTVTDNLDMFADGKHVDVVICDEPVATDCREWYSTIDAAKNRFVEYDWYGELNQYISSIDDDGQSIPTAPYANYFPNAAMGAFHGGHCAGTVAGATYGWAREANIYSLQVLYANNGTPPPILLVFDYLRAFHKYKPVNPETGYKNPTITSHSWGYGFNWYSYFERAITTEDINSITVNGTVYNSGNPGPNGWTMNGLLADFGVGAYTYGYPSDNASIRADAEDAVEDGVVVIGAAANDNRWAAKNESGHPSMSHWNNSISMNIPGLGNYSWYSDRGSSPNNGEGIITVGSIESLSDFRRSDFSNYGPFIDVWAPGSDIVSVWPNPANLTGSWTNVGNYDTKYGGDNWFYPISGTSMATPQVSGVAACLATGKERFTNSDVLAFIQQKGLQGDMTFNMGTGLFNDATNDGSQNGLYALTDPHLELRSHNPRLTTGHIEGWYKGNLKGARRPSHSFQNAQMYPRNNTFHRPLVYPSPKSFTYITTAPTSGNYTITGDDRINNFTGDNNPTINVYIGDTLIFSMNAPGHPLWISDTNSTGQPNGTSRQVPSGVSGNGTQNGGNVTWDTTGLSSGTYYYNCEYHTPMYGEINLIRPA